MELTTVGIFVTRRTEVFRWSIGHSADQISGRLANLSAWSLREPQVPIRR
jgi:hypothetical protein